MIAEGNGKSGKSMSFDGVGNWVDIGNNFSDSIEGMGTISAWVYRMGTTGGIFARSTGT